MNIAILINESKDKNYTFTLSLINYLENKGQSVYLEKDVASFLRKGVEITTSSIKKVDVIIVLGGDGTILVEAHKYKDYNLPILGINLGRVGCLTEGNPEDAFNIIDKLLDGKYKIEDRIVLEGILKKKNETEKVLTSYNEISISRGTRLKMIEINIKVNNCNDTSFFADGVIVATPTGSSAYSLSCGGPLLIPTAKSFVITPISAQCRNITSLVVSSDDSITISLNNSRNVDQSPALLSIDGEESIQMNIGDLLELKQSNKTLKIIKVNLNSSLYDPLFKVTSSIK